MKKLRIILICLVLIGLVLINEIHNAKLSKMKSLDLSVAGFQEQVFKQSKARIVAEINQIAGRILQLERNTGKTGSERYKVYSSQETVKFIELYQALILRLHYLNYGNLQININQWGNYTLSAEANKPYAQDQVVKAMTALENSGLPPTFLENFKIYLLPYVIPDVSGLGGTGYTLLSAQSKAEDLIDNQLSVTLYHELGHHIQLTFMPSETLLGKKLWSTYLQIIGGTWHDAGSINTEAWSSSSEETFAEDFRMLFGPDQPFFGDVKLGDPRSEAQRVTKETQFMIDLAKQKGDHSYQSPWIPGRRLDFWQFQGTLIVFLWGLLGIGILMVKGFLPFWSYMRKYSS